MNGEKDPKEVTMRYPNLEWLPDAPAEEIVPTRDELVDIAGYVRRKDRHAYAEALRCARLTEWHMAHRWPAKGSTGRRGDDRPSLGDTSPKDRDAWQEVYAVGRADYDRLLAETEPEELSQAAVGRWACDAAVNGVRGLSPTRPRRRQVTLRGRRQTSPRLVSRTSPCRSPPVERETSPARLLSVSASVTVCLLPPPYRGETTQ